MSLENRAPLLSRRNGRPVACNPCRARKVACDHQRPICNRCHRRQQSSQCRYPELATPSPSTPIEDFGQFSSSAASRSRSEPVTDPVLPPRPGLAPSSPNPGFFGYTSSNSVFEETESCLALLVGTTPDLGQKLPGVEKNELSISFRDLPAHLRETCLLVLRCLPGQSNEQIVYAEGPDKPDEPRGLSYIVVSRIVESLRVTYRDVLAQGDVGLQAMAEILCSNTRRPVLDEFSDSQRWLDQICGKNIRWESLGLLWAHLARVSDVMDSMRRPSVDWVEGKESLETARTCIESCIQLAGHFTDGNPFFLDLNRRFATLCSIVDGDAEFSSHAPHGVSIAMLTFLGLHALENGPSYKPSLCSEYKRRIVAMIFAGDKLGVAFTGRPPFISRRYCSTPLLLDIRDEHLAADEATLMKSFYSLDEHGWNTDGKLYPATLIRARSMIAVIRDELIELALEKGAFVTIEQLLNIKDRARATSSNFPSGLAYRPEDVDDTTTESEVVYLRIIIQLDYLQNIFFAERLLLRYGHMNDGDLLATSFEMVCLTLKLWIHKDRFSTKSMRRNYEWLLMAYGAPGGGILCQELLYPTFTGTHHKHSGLTRSSIVQQLSMLVGFLDWVRPSAPNGALCADSKAVIQRILDHHLNSGSSSEDIIDSMDWGVFSQPDFSMELLDTFDWMRTDGG